MSVRQNLYVGPDAGWLVRAGEHDDDRLDELTYPALRSNAGSSGIPEVRVKGKLYRRHCFIPAQGIPWPGSQASVRACRRAACASVRACRTGRGRAQAAPVAHRGRAQAAQVACVESRSDRIGQSGAAQEPGGGASPGQRPSVSASNDRQRTALLRHAGVARFVYNWGLEQKLEARQEGRRAPNAIELHRRLNALEQAELGWLYGVSKCCGPEALRDLDRACP